MLNAVREELLDYASFVDNIRKMLIKRMGKGYDVEIFIISNNNSSETILSVRKEGRKFAPDIYLHAYYESYLAGTCLTDIVDRLYMIYTYCAVPLIKEDTDFTYENIKSHIFFRLINFNRNLSRLTQVPYIKLWDLAITFHCLVRDKDDSITTIGITNEHIKRWGKNVDDLYRLAYKNTSRLFPLSLKSMKEVFEEYEGYSDKNDNETGDTYPMFVFTDEDGIYGAFCILYKNVIRDLACLLNSNLYILPSSIHEVILIPMEEGLEKEFLKRIIAEVNENILSEDEILSDNVYIYSLENDIITI